MAALFILPLILAFSPAAVWALRGGGLPWLWVLCTLALLSVLLLAIGLSTRYSVPNAPRVALYLLAFCGPSILLATSLLSLRSTVRSGLLSQLAVAFAGSIVGLGLGFIVVVYGLRVW